MNISDLEEKMAMLLEKHSSRPIDKITASEFVEAYGIDTDKARAALSTVSAEEIAAIYSALAHFSGGCCPDGLCEVNTLAAAKLAALIPPGVADRQRAISARHRAEGATALQSNNAAAAGLPAPSADNVREEIAKAMVMSQVFGGGKPDGSLH
jgi:hypothetical protein